MKIDVVPLPKMLKDEHVRDRVVVVFDVLRATTTIAAALAAGAKEIRVFDSIEGARSAAAEYSGAKLLCGETKCLAPSGFDLGNSPGAYVPERVGGKTLFLSTTNGTRALVAAREAKILVTGALVNAFAVAQFVRRLRLDVTLLCAGTDGKEAPEDKIGAGAVAFYLSDPTATELPEKANSQLARQMVTKLRQTEGGRNVLQAGLPEDVEFAAQVDALNVVPQCNGRTLTIRAAVFPVSFA
jgi:2-phosphosulfolactate phosphatase